MQKEKTQFSYTISDGEINCQWNGIYLTVYCDDFWSWVEANDLNYYEEGYFDSWSWSDVRTASGYTSYDDFMKHLHNDTVMEYILQTLK